MIRIASTRNYIISLESVAMTDIVLNMFIFFFISFSLIYTFNPDRTSKVEVNLPTSKSIVSMQGEEKTILTLTREGKVYLGADRIDMKSLKGTLKARLAQERSFGLVLRVDRLARFNNVVNVLDVINELGIAHVSVAAVKTTK